MALPPSPWLVTGPFTHCSRRHPHPGAAFYKGSFDPVLCISGQFSSFGPSKACLGGGCGTMRCISVDLTRSLPPPSPVLFTTKEPSFNA